MIKVYRTVESKKQYFKRMPNLNFNSEEFEADLPTVSVNTDQTFQTHMGFGGAFTESASYVLATAGEKVREEVAKAYFSKEGLRYNMGRLSVHSNDFALGNYTYVEEGDAELKTFDCSHEEKWTLPFVDQAQAVAERQISYVVSCWSAPAWMKTNDDMNHGGKLRRKYWGVWAEYCCKYIKTLISRGINVTMMTIQNEPEATQTWESCLFTAKEELEYIKTALIPALKKYGLNTKIFIWDHNRDRVARRSAVTLADKEVRDAVYGVAYHWYVGEESKNLSVVHSLSPEKHLLLTECCVELTAPSENENGKRVTELAHAERYGRNIINDFNNWSEGWIDWNMTLDHTGGPNHVNNFCEAPVMIMQDGSVKYNPSYYYIGHFSKFIEPGAKRVNCVNDCEKELYSVAYKNPNGETVVVMQNEGWIKNVSLYIDGKGVNVNMPSNSIITLVLSE